MGQRGDHFARVFRTGQALETAGPGKPCELIIYARLSRSKVLDEFAGHTSLAAVLGMRLSSP